MAETIRFLLGDEARTIAGVDPTTTTLDWLRSDARLTGTKEGCAEGDCGACTVILRERRGDGTLGQRAVNSCILFVGQLHGRQLLAVEHLATPDAPHPVQSAMVEEHASQCGFCTPGLAVQIAAGAASGRLGDASAAADWIAGNLCRCTGYGGLVRAAVRTNGQSLPGDEARIAQRLATLDDDESLELSGNGRTFLQPRTVEEAVAALAERPGATVLAGATDIGLWVTKSGRRPEMLVDVTRIAALRTVTEGPDAVRIGAAVTHAEARPVLARLHPDLDELMRRFAGEQIRASGTVGGNIANGSPIGDLPPALIALDATVTLRSVAGSRDVPLDRFFIAYGRQDRRPDELLTEVRVPRLGRDDVFFCAKVSKRFDSDISAVMAAFRLRFAEGIVSEARLAFGGMAATPKRAMAAEGALVGRPFDEDAVRDATRALAEDFQPIDDLRATAAYRLTVAGNLLSRFLLEREADGPVTRLPSLRLASAG